MINRIIRINNPYGIHVRIAAMIVNKASDIKSKYGINLYISKSEKVAPLAISMLSLLSLRIQFGDNISISSEENDNNAILSVNELCSYIIENFNTIGSSMTKIDEILEENNFANEQIIDNFPIGVFVTDVEGNITTVNKYSLEFLNKRNEEIIGKHIKDIFKCSKIDNALKDHKINKGEIQNYDEHIIIINRAPIFVKDNLIGAIEMFQDVSTLVSIYEEEINYYKDELLRQDKIYGKNEEIIGDSKKWLECFAIANKASNSTSTVLLRGESGTGKELIAKHIHNNSNRKNKAFVRVNCAAIPENLLESELFGYEKGAFTGAVKSKPGKFLIADGGTIFLDEIGDMPKTMQVKLLRVLQEREFESVGGIEPIKVDIRIIAATNRDLESLMAGGEFRSDLYYRLNVMGINIPSLRDRKEDISKLVEHFIKKVNIKLNKDIHSIQGDALEALIKYDWPGNVRELENIIERATNMCEKDIITLSDLPIYISNEICNNNELINVKNNELCSFEEYEKEIIQKAMLIYKSYNKAGKALGLTHRTISLKCKKYGI